MNEKNEFIWEAIIFGLLIVLLLGGAIFEGFRESTSAKETCKQYNETVYRNSGDKIECYDSNGILHIREVKPNEHI